MSLASRIKNARKEKHYTQKELASLLHVKPATVSGWEVGRNEPSLNMLNELANVLDVSFEYLAGVKTAPADRVHNMTVDEALGTIMSFDGKPVTDHDKKVMKDLLESYLRNKQ